MCIRDRRKVVLSFCVQGCYYTFTGYCGQMDEKRLVTLLASIARAAQRIRTVSYTHLVWSLRQKGNSRNRVMKLV